MQSLYKCSYAFDAYSYDYAVVVSGSTTMQSWGDTAMQSLNFDANEIFFHGHGSGLHMRDV